MCPLSIELDCSVHRESEPGATKIQHPWSTTYCVVTDDRGVLMVRFVASMRHVGNRQLVHHTHEDDAVAVRLWHGLF